MLNLTGMFKRVSSILYAVAMVVPVTLTPGGASLAHEGAVGIVKQRMDAMSEMGDALGVMADMVKRKRPFDPNQVRISVDSLRQHANGLVESFPDTEESRNGVKTEALPLIWEDWSRFVELSDELEMQLGKFQATSENGLDEQTMRVEFRKIARACSACHEDFRKPKD